MAAITAAIIGGAAALGSAAISSKAGKDAAKSQTKASNATIAEQRRQYDLSRADQMPWMQTGKWALGQQEAAMKGDFSGFYNAPDYQFALSEGLKTQDRSAASKGRLYSGGYGEDLTRFGQGLATQNYGNYWNRLGNLSGTGQTTATNLGSLGQNYANQYGNAQQNTADARASSYANSANQWGNAASQIGGIAGNYFGSKYTPTPYSGMPNTSAGSSADWYSGIGAGGTASNWWNG